MARTLPIPAGQPLDATRTAAGQVVTLAAAQAVAVQTAASITLAALLWPLIPAAGAVAGLASTLGQQLPLRPLPAQQVLVMPGPGGAGRAATAPGGRGAVRTASLITLGVEEEFVLLDPSTGATVLAGPELVRMLGGEPGVQPELMRFQVETATGVCTSLDEAGRELVRLRRLAAAAAARLGCALVASGVAPYRTPGLAAVTPQPRYQELARRYAPVVAQAGTCACHVHVGVPSRDLGVQVLARVRPWLALLLAITANSPIAGGPIPDGPAGGMCSSPAGRPRPRPRRGRTPPPTTRRSAASSGTGRRWTSGMSTSWPGCPRATRPWRSGSPTSAWTPAPRCCWPG